MLAAPALRTCALFGPPCSSGAVDAWSILPPAEPVQQPQAHEMFVLCNCTVSCAAAWSAAKCVLQGRAAGLWLWARAGAHAWHYAALLHPFGCCRRSPAACTWTQVWWWVPKQSVQEFKRYAEGMTEGGRKELYTKSISPFLQDREENPPQPTLPLEVSARRARQGGRMWCACCMCRRACVRASDC